MKAAEREEREREESRAYGQYVGGVSVETRPPARSLASSALGLEPGGDWRARRVGGALEGVRVVAVAAGVAHSMAVASDGSVFTWGYGGDGRLGHGDRENQLSPRRVGGALAGLW